MVFHRLHRWTLTPKAAVALQRRLAPRVVRRGDCRGARLFVGSDAAFTVGECIAAVVVWDAERDVVVEQVVARRPLRFPYVPGLLTFREAPAILAAFRRLTRNPDVFLFDGQGYAHPRRFGLASHLGLWLDRPSIGCAKSVLIGRYEEMGTKRGSASPLMDKDEQIGIALRTREGVRPIFVSVGHRLSLDAARRLVVDTCVRSRVPEPIRLADCLVAMEKRRGNLPRTGAQ